MTKNKKGREDPLIQSWKRPRKMIERKRCRKYFESLPVLDVYYEIMRRLSSSDIYVAASVNRRWREILSKQTVNSLYSVTPYHGSPHFLVQLCHREHSAPFFIEVDNQGNCHKLDMDIINFAGQKNVFADILGVTYNGLILVWCVSREGEKGETTMLCVFNPYVKRVKRIPWPDGHASELIDSDGYGLCYDAATATLTIVMVHLDKTDGIYYVHIYNSASEEWSRLTVNMPIEKFKMKAKCFNVNYWSRFLLFSWGCIFDMHSSAGLLCLSLKNQEFKVAPLPGCPFPVDESKCRIIWQLIGWQENLYALMTCHDSKVRSAYWKLVLSGETENAYGWQYVNILSCDHGIDPSNVNRDELWLCSTAMKRIDTRIILRLCNNNGEDIKKIIQRNLMELLGVSNAGLRVRKIWPIEVSNICWPRA